MDIIVSVNYVEIKRKRVDYKWHNIFAKSAGVPWMKLSFILPII